MGGGRWWLTLILIHFIIHSSLFCSQVGASNSNETDRLALLAFKANIHHDPFGIMNHWNDNTHVCQWYGVTCGKRHPRVTALELSDLNLGGSISPHIGNLSFLRSLHLYNNNFIRQIPPEIGRLRRLQNLDLSNNTLSGEIPLNLSSCSELMYLYLYTNNLIGHLPPLLGNLTFLEELFVADNNLSGRIPKSLGDLKNLTLFSLAINNFSGEMPLSLFNLSSITLFEVNFNHLEGRLPSNLFHTLPKLVNLSIDKNQFVGPIPASLSNASNLQILQISSNNFIGKVPPLESLTKLSIFTTAYNHLGSGIGAKDDLTFICSLTNATSLMWLQIGSNNFGGMFPQCITNLSSHLIIMSMNSNHISGSIPPGIDNLIGLEVLLLLNNPFTGSIPPTIGNLQNLRLLDLSINGLSGPIPSSIGQLQKLVSLDLSFNSLEGTIPSSLQNCTFLQSLYLDLNNLIGSIPPQVFSIPSLSLHLSISYNQLIGPLPEEVGNLINLYMLDVSGNMLSGKLPTRLGECTSMQQLALNGNNFHGSIPSSWSSMKGLKFLDLASNNLSGQIPNFFSSFDALLFLNLSFNNLEGSMPMIGVFTNATAISVQGNIRLCGGIPEFHLAECKSPLEKKKRKLSLKIKLAIAIVSGLVGIGLLSLLFCVLRLKRQQRQSQVELAIATSESPPLQFVSYGDLHRATNGFSQENLVGIGSFGHVYKGILGEEGQVFAIKVLNLKNLRASNSFIAECLALRNIRHKNLVKVFTVCSAIDYQRNEFKAIVYEFMTNGSLEDWLHKPPLRMEDKGVNQQIPPRKFGLLQRLSIAIDVASLLEYVHHEFGTPIVHCDIKPSNILLDGDLSAHVSDFGLSKFLSNIGIIHNSVPVSSSIGVRGTVGYAPPEYGLGNKVSTQGDVYSYGILLLEMFTGKRPTHEMFKEGLSLHLFAKMALSSGVADMLDPTLLDLLEAEVLEINPSRSVTVMDCLVSIIEIGVACSLDSSSERMNMNMVTTKLCKIRDNLFGMRN